MASTFASVKKKIPPFSEKGVLPDLIKERSKKVNGTKKNSRKERFLGSVLGGSVVFLPTEFRIKSKNKLKKNSTKVLSPVLVLPLKLLQKTSSFFFDSPFKKGDVLSMEEWLILKGCSYYMLHLIGVPEGAYIDMSLTCSLIVVP